MDVWMKVMPSSEFSDMYLPPVSNSLPPSLLPPISHSSFKFRRLELRAPVFHLLGLVAL